VIIGEITILLVCNHGGVVVGCVELMKVFTRGEVGGREDKREA
jgi:hypothetical protein